MRKSVTGNNFYGWFDDASQSHPTYDPPYDAPCLLCGFRIKIDDVRTHCLMYTGDYAPRSYFYRTHQSCAEQEGDVTSLDGFILDMIARAGE